MNDDRVLEQAEAWIAEGRKVALATVVKTWGSAPRPAGSQLAINDTGAFVGSVSGGCIEGAVAAEAQAIMKSGEVVTLHFGVSNEQAWDIGLACGGEIEVFVERVA
ncbi:MAG: XdhC family protein [Micropepsaceae bacterium]